MADLRLLAQATQYAARALGDQNEYLRGTRICAAAADLTGDSELLAAAMLLPTVEAIPSVHDEVRRIFGTRVLRMAQSASVKDSDAAGWQTARLRELNALRAAPDDTLMLVLARAVSELRTLCAAETVDGPKALGWYYASLTNAVKVHERTDSYRELTERVRMLFGAM